MQPICRIALAATLAWLILPGTGWAAEAQDACVGQITAPGTVIRTPGTWCMTKNESFRSSYAIISVAAEGVTIDCKGFALTYVGPDQPRYRGAIESQSARLTVRNCTFKGFGIGISVAPGTMQRIEHNTFDRSAVRLGGRSDPTSGVVRDNVFRNTGLQTTGTFDIIDNTFAGVDPYDGTGGLWVSGSQASIRGNRISGGPGMTVHGGRAKVRDNVLTGTGAGTGIDCVLAGAYPAWLKGNFITGFATAHHACADAGGNITH